ncbi:MAG TPA: phenylacetate--CoA ligase family protein, partial [Dissulfuribacter thermophilus]|nr:phenylacetate--CoA ligase family protein [Dissulfuribacter thermophilus]
YWDDYYILEILDPETLEDVEPGEVGEMVVTTLRKEATPLIRYRTRDLTRLIPGECPCGLKYPRHDRILGRSDDMFIVRGVNVYPGHVDEILSGIDAVSSEYLIEITREKGLDLMCIKVERKKGLVPDIDQDLAKEVRLRIKSSLMVSPRVEIVDYGALPRSEKKSKRVYDYRQQS